MKVFFLTVLFLIILEIGGFFGVIFSGVYDVAATSGHSFFTQWVAGVVVKNSVQKRSRELSVPAWFASANPTEGFGLYDKHCLGCHGAPGIEPNKLPQRMEPSPPRMTKVAKYWSPKELYWITTHGIKMTGMAPFDKVFSKDQGWHLVAFLKTLPTMTAKQYADLKAAAQKASGSK